MKKSFACALLGAVLMGATVASIARATEESASPASVESTYVGMWKVKDSKERVFFIVIKAGGEAASKWEDEAEAKRGQHGTWKQLDDKVVVLWDNGWRETISATETGFVKKAYAPKWTLEGKPSNESPAEKVESKP